MSLHFVFQILHDFDFSVEDQEVEVLDAVLWAARSRNTDHSLVRVLKQLQFLLKMKYVLVKIDEILQDEKHLLYVILGHVGAFDPLV